MPDDGTLSVLVAGIGGQGVLLASDVIARVAASAGRDVKKSEVHGMAQRGGSVVSHVRFGPRVHSPLIRVGAADFVLAFDEYEGRRNAGFLKPDGITIWPPPSRDVLPHPRTLNVYLLGALSTRLEIPEASWLEEIERRVPPKALEVNREAFRRGRQSREESAS
jgi:indolepyruvate ferredoxin oxidoreductase beta subunit